MSRSMRAVKGRLGHSLPRERCTEPFSLGLLSFSVLLTFDHQFCSRWCRALEHAAYAADVLRCERLEEDFTPVLDETHLGAWLDVKFSTKPNWNDNPTSCCYMNRIRNSSMLKNVSNSHEFSNRVSGADCSFDGSLQEGQTVADSHHA